MVIPQRLGLGFRDRSIVQLGQNHAAATLLRARAITGVHQEMFQRAKQE